MEKYLEECLNSIVNQTIDGLEVIAVNDGSIDSSLEILNRYSEEYPNIIVYSQKNQGQASAKNYGILHARGEYINFMDPDDYYPDNMCLERLYNCAKKQQALICAGIILNNRNGIIETMQPELIKEYYQNQFVNTWDYEDIYGHTRYLFDTEFLLNNNIFFPLYRKYEDQPFTVKALALAGKFYASNIPMYTYRVGYKNEHYSLSVCTDIIRGIRDVAKICRQYNLDKMYENNIKDISLGYIVPFYKYSFCGNEEIDNVIEELNGILLEWKGEEYQPITKDYVCDIRNANLEYYSSITDVLCNGQPVILFGAGKNAITFIEIFRQNLQNVIGLAVSNNTNEEVHQGIKVQNVKQYNTEELKKNAFILVTTSEVYWKDIKNILDNIGFQNIIYLEMSRLRWADKVLNGRP